MDTSNMQHLIDAETRREIAQLHYDLSVIKRRSWVWFFIPLMWFKVTFGTITIEIKEKRVKEKPVPLAPQIAPLDQFVFNRVARRLDKDLEYVEEEFFNEDFWQDDYLEK